jgi:carbonic anhydrase
MAMMSLSYSPSPIPLLPYQLYPQPPLIPANPGFPAPMGSPGFTVQPFIPTDSIFLPNRVLPYASHLPSQVGFPKVHPSAAVRHSWVLGDVTIAPSVHVVNATIRADEGSPFYIGPYSNIQDGVVIHAHYTEENGQPVMHNLEKGPDGKLYGVYIGQNVSVAHQALIHGPSLIGDNSFIGFKATVRHANVGKNVEIGAHAYIDNVTIPDNVGIAAGAIIQKPEDIAKYFVPLKNKNAKIATINQELVRAYQGGNWVN